MALGLRKNTGAVEGIGVCAMLFEVESRCLHHACSVLVDGLQVIIYFSWQAFAAVMTLDFARW